MKIIITYTCPEHGKVRRIDLLFQENKAIVFPALGVPCSEPDCPYNTSIMVSVEESIDCSDIKLFSSIEEETSVEIKRLSVEVAAAMDGFARENEGRQITGVDFTSLHVIETLMEKLVDNRSLKEAEVNEIVESAVNQI